MLKQVEGIIASNVNYGETSKIVNILTNERKLKRELDRL